MSTYNIIRRITLVREQLLYRLCENPAYEIKLCRTLLQACVK
jgi:hypothetical protein